MCYTGLTGEGKTRAQNRPDGQEESKMKETKRVELAYKVCNRRGEMSWKRRTFQSQEALERWLDKKEADENFDGFIDMMTRTLD